MKKQSICLALSLFGFLFFWMQSKVAAYESKLKNFLTSQSSTHAIESSKDDEYLPHAETPIRGVTIFPDGGWMVSPDIRRTVVLPTGDIVEPGGIVILREGLRYQIVYRDGNPVGYQLFDSSGRRLRPGEALEFWDGTRLIQPSF